MWFSIALGLFAVLSSVEAHTVFTTLFINDQNQGDGTCVRMPKEGRTSTNPIKLSSPDLACGRDGSAAVAFTCPAPAGSNLTFEFREYADASQPGALDPSHKGPCSVYLKQVDNMTTTAVDGDGWFKIWESGYDEATGKWCTEKLIADNGLLSVQLPSALPTGYFLVRPELLALHQAYRGDPQFYAGCAQLFVQGTGAGTLDVPADKKISIPGHVKPDDKSVTFNIYNQTLDLPYPIPGPEVYFPVLPTSTAGNKAAAAKVQQQTQGLVPADCLLKNANWCGVEVESYSDEAGCWAACEACYAQGKTCYDSAPPTGSVNCRVWEGKCKGIQDACKAGRFTGPPDKGIKLVAVETKVPGPIPGVEGVAGTSVVAGEAAASTVAATQEMSATSVAVAPSSVSATANGSEPEPTDDTCPGEVVSKDGLCGGDLGQTCQGSEFGGCCSKFGKCGSSRLYCGCGCQRAFGECK